MKKVIKETMTAYAINYFFSPLINIWCAYVPINFNWGKRVKGNIQFPVVDFKDSQGMVVRFFGVSHFATKEYYEVIYSMVSEAEKEGAIVLYELVRKKGEEIVDVQIRLGALQGTPFFKILKSVGLVLQYVEALVPKKTWINVDITLEELLSSGEFTFGVSLGSIPRRFKTWTSIAAIDMLLEMGQILSPLYLFAKGKKQETVLIKRNEMAVTQSLECFNRSRGIMMIWGAMHLPGINDLLKAHGFKEVKREWITAYTAVSLPKV